jgi:DNA-binding MarR family transcriptional regulator
MTRSGRPASGELVDELVAASRFLVAIAARSMAELGEDVTLGQYRALIILATYGPQRTSDLAEQLAISSSTVTRMCDRLIRKDLIRRYRRSDDRRATWVALTEAGRSLVGEVMRLRRSTLAKVARAIPPEDRASMIVGLRSLLDAAGEPVEAEWWRRWRKAADSDPFAVEG